MVDAIHLSAKALAQLQQAARQRDLAQRSPAARLNSVLLIRVQGARLIKPADIRFEEE